MEFISANLINTTTQIAVNSNTTTAENLFNRDLSYQYYTDGMNDDNTTSSITITFDATTPVSRIAMLGINYKEFRFFYNGATANAFTLVGGDTNTSSYLTNADENKYFRFSTIQCSSITIETKKTITANQEKSISLLHISDLQLTLDPRPSAKNFKPKKKAKQVVHKLSDGGYRLHNVRIKWETVIKLDFISQSLRDSLEDLYDAASPFAFCPFGTTTSWDAQFAEMVWDGDFNFYEFSENAESSGFSGSISLKETST